VDDKELMLMNFRPSAENKTIQSYITIEDVSRVYPPQQPLTDFEPKYKMKPDYLSYDEYGTVTLASLLMFVNSIPCIEDFNLVTVVIPSFQSIVSICSDNFPEKEISKLMEVPW